MSDSDSEVRIIPIDKIHVVNPRTRNKIVFADIIKNISRVGLKKPITVSQRESSNGDRTYDLVCGQGRLEAYAALGAKEIPAFVISASKEDRLLMSLVENVARRRSTTVELIREVRSQKERGCTADEIGTKLDLEPSYVHGILHLLEHGEERLVQEVEKGRVALTVAIRIANSKDEEIQRLLCEAYEDNTLRGEKLWAVRRILEQRKTHGKGVYLGGGPRKSKSRPTKEALLKAYRQETQRQKLLVKKAVLTESRLLVIVSALKKILQDENFVTLLRAEALADIPKYLADKISACERS
jgi:ParB family transcriptional regulator, chromosome partitioning protein